MNATRKARPAEDDQSVAPETQSTPRQIQSGTIDHSLTLQAIMELQKSVGEMNANVTATRASVESLKGKVEDLVAWKNRILGCAAVLGAIIAIGAFILGKASDYVTNNRQPCPCLPCLLWLLKLPSRQKYQ